jgi:CHASE3 domain sensor protein
LVVAIIATALAFAGLYQSRLNLISHTFEVERELARFLATTQEAELAARGYVRTVDEQFKAEFEEVRATVPQRIDGIAILTQDNPEQQATLQQLRSVVEQKFEDAAAAMEQRRTGQSNDSITTFVSGRSHALMHQLGALVSEMEAAKGAGGQRSGTCGRAVSPRRVRQPYAATLAVIVIWFRDRMRSMKALSIASPSRRGLPASVAGYWRRGGARSAALMVHKMEAVGQLTGA